MIVGIDPGSRVGLAALALPNALVDIRTYSWLKQREKILTWLAEIRNRGGRVAVIEEPGESVYPRAGLSRAAMLKLAWNVGQCAERARELALACQQMGYHVLLRRALRPPAGRRRRRPAGAAAGYRKGGVQQSAFRALFPGAPKRTSSHARDAALLALAELAREDSYA